MGEAKRRRTLVAPQLSKMVSTEIGESHCPFCGHVLQLATSLHGSTPAPGCVAICYSCANPLVFEDSMRMRAMTPTEFAALPDAALATVHGYQQRVRQRDRRRLADG